jgi:hypothetical protein
MDRALQKYYCADNHKHVPLHRFNRLLYRVSLWLMRKVRAAKGSVLPNRKDLNLDWDTDSATEI